LHRFVACVVIISLLGLGTAAAWGAPASDLATGSSTVLDAHSHHGDTSNSPHGGHCDHGCHFSAHLTGLPSSFTVGFIAVPVPLAIDFDPPLISSFQAPPRKPPRG
jgi:hypothetical protein